jgi:hypothetical protein
MRVALLLACTPLPYVLKLARGEITDDARCRRVKADDVQHPRIVGGSDGKAIAHHPNHDQLRAVYGR